MGSILVWVHGVGVGVLAGARVMGGQLQGVATALWVSAVKWSPEYRKYSCIMAPLPSMVWSQFIGAVVPIARRDKPVMLSLLGLTTIMHGSRHDSKYLLTSEKVSCRSVVSTALCSSRSWWLSSVTMKTLYKVEKGFSPFPYRLHTWVIWSINSPPYQGTRNIG